MKRFAGLVTWFLALALFMATPAMAGAPFTNIEGVGGAALNPFAYIANPVTKGETCLMGNKAVSRPQVGIWNVGLTESKINWWSAGINDSFFNRIELGYSHEFVDVEGLQNISKDNLSMKVNMIKESDFGIDLMPAVSAGLIWKDTGFDRIKLRNSSDADYYLVATKMFNGCSLPIILNAGLLSTKGYVRGVLGFGNHRDNVFFGNAEAVLFGKFLTGIEYEQDAHVGKVFEGDNNTYSTHALWEGHVAYMYDDHLTMIASYANTGDKDSVGQTGFGGAYVLSMQYAF